MTNHANEIKEIAEKLRNKVRLHSKEINNPALTTGFLSELDFFIENLEENEE